MILVYLGEYGFRNLHIPWVKYLHHHRNITPHIIFSDPSTSVPYMIKALLSHASTDTLATSPFGISEARSPYFPVLFASGLKKGRFHPPPPPDFPPLRLSPPFNMIIYYRAVSRYLPVRFLANSFHTPLPSCRSFIQPHNSWGKYHQ